MEHTFTSLAAKAPSNSVLPHLEKGEVTKLSVLWPSKYKPTPPSRKVNRPFQHVPPESHCTGPWEMTRVQKSFRAFLEFTAVQMDGAPILTWWNGVFYSFCKTSLSTAHNSSAFRPSLPPPETTRVAGVSAVSPLGPKLGAA